jgi:NADH-quinone oxidoreductase subunit L
MSIGTWGWLVLAFPLAGAIVCALLYRSPSKKLVGYIGSSAIFLAFLSGLGALIKLQDLPEEHRSAVSNAFDYAKSAGISVKLGILIDPLSIFMVLVVTGVSFLIHVYSTAYMESDQGYARFFSYLNFFVFSMLLLVLASNFVLLIVGWAFVGAASYLLISFWYRRATATYAGIKAFVMNVIGDIGLVIGAFILFQHTGALDFAGVFAGAKTGFHGINDGPLVAACILLLVGAFAKSAQVPLHTWLPDAMEGPTPVSALIHAATMVTAGVYLIARMHPLFEQAPAAADVGAIGGCVTLLIAATIALVVTDLKRVIAYSTMSQIGYMIMGVSIFAYSAGLFHLMTHAFFKALLFMSAGSVISAMGGEQNMDRMGGFRRAMPFTFVAFTVGALALAGVPPFAGLFSKDEILVFAIDRGGMYAVLGVLGYVGSLLTAFYAGRMVFRTFFGEQSSEAEQLMRGELAHGEHRNPATGEEEDTEVGFPGPEHHIAERAPAMRFAMAPLAFLAVVAGAAGIPGATHVVEKFLDPTFADSKLAGHVPSAGAGWAGLAVGAVLGIAGFAIAYVLYERRAGYTLQLRDRFRPVHDFLFNKWGFDDLYDRVFVGPARSFGQWGRDRFESAIVQGVFVGGAAGLVRTGTNFARAIQNGYLRVYALVLLIGVGALVLYFLLEGVSA